MTETKTKTVVRVDNKETKATNKVGSKLVAIKAEAWATNRVPANRAIKVVVNRGATRTKTKAPAVEAKVALSKAAVNDCSYYHFEKRPQLSCFGRC